MSNMASDSGDCEYELSKSPQKFTEADINKLKNRARNDDELLPEVPLQTPWTFWYDKTIPGTSAEEFTKNLEVIYRVETVQGFWAVFHHIPGPDALKSRYSYHFMKEDRRPVWEDAENQKGGTWRFKCYKKDTSKVWKELLLAAIGEQFVDYMADGDSVCGVTVTVRDKDDLIQVWNLSAELANKSTILRKIYQLLPDVSFLTEFYKAHETHQAFSGPTHQHKR